MEPMTKIVYNACYGGFSISSLAIERYWEIKGEEKPDDWSQYDIERTDPVLIRVIEELGHDADGDCADLYVKELPKGTLYRIDEYDGLETVMTIDEYHWLVA